MVEQGKAWLNGRLQELTNMLDDVKLNRTPLAGQPIALEIVRGEIPEHRQRLATDWDTEVAKTLDRLEGELAEAQAIYDKRKKDKEHRGALALRFAGVTIQ